MSIAAEFKEFIAKGNVLDLAVGVIIGGAFGKIVTSLVDDVIMPPIGKLTGGVDFSSKFIDLSGTNPASLDAAKKAGLPVIGYGAFLNSVIQFLIIAFVIFMIVKAVNLMRRTPPPAPEAPAPPSDEVVLLTQIRDALTVVK